MIITEEIVLHVIDTGVMDEVFVIFKEKLLVNGEYIELFPM